MSLSESEEDIVARSAGVQSAEFFVVSTLDIEGRTNRPFHGAVYKQQNEGVDIVAPPQKLIDRQPVLFPRPVLTFRERFTVNRWFIISQFPDTDLQPELTLRHLRCLRERGRAIEIGTTAFLGLPDMLPNLYLVYVAEVSKLTTTPVTTKSGLETVVSKGPCKEMVARVPLTKEGLLSSSMGLNQSGQPRRMARFVLSRTEPPPVDPDNRPCPGFPWSDIRETRCAGNQQRSRAKSSEACKTTGSGDNRRNDTVQKLETSQEDRRTGHATPRRFDHSKNTHSA